MEYHIERCKKEGEKARVCRHVLTCPKHALTWTKLHGKCERLRLTCFSSLCFVQCWKHIVETYILKNISKNIGYFYSLIFPFFKLYQETTLLCLFNASAHLKMIYCLHNLSIVLIRIKSKCVGQTEPLQNNWLVVRIKTKILHLNVSLMSKCHD